MDNRFKNNENKKENTKNSIFENTKKYLLSLGMTTAMLFSTEAQTIGSNTFVDVETAKYRKNINEHTKSTENISIEIFEAINNFEKSISHLDDSIKNRLIENNGEDLYLKNDGTVLDYSERNINDYISLGYTKELPGQFSEFINNKTGRLDSLETDTSEYVLFSDQKNNGDTSLYETYARYGDSVLVLNTTTSIDHFKESEFSKYIFYKTDKTIIRECRTLNKSMLPPTLIIENKFDLIEHTDIVYTSHEYTPSSPEYKNLIQEMESKVFELESKLANIPENNSSLH